MTKKSWPKDFPSDVIVPPDYATDLNMQLFRFVSKVSPDAQDFLPTYKDPEQKSRWRNKKNQLEPCFYGTSFYETAEHLDNLLAAFPERFKLKKIAKGQISPEHGKGAPTRSEGHVSVWFYDGVYPEGFQVL
ncbi:hypothetical protein [Shewanella indica]|uniref:hypothetical protein n=1 Tax=Shewanella indica TaxID=768528 RepID=UPI0039996198